MFSIEKFKLFKHSFVFENMYKNACDELILMKIMTRSQVNNIEKEKKKCKFEEKILLYKKNDEIIGFCVYNFIDDYAIIILDFVKKEYRGGGRKCRELMSLEFKGKKGIKFSVSKKNYPSHNSIKKIELNMLKYFRDIKKETRIDFPDHIFYTAIYRA